MRVLSRIVLDPGHYLVVGCLWFIPVAVAALLVWQEVQFRETFTRQPVTFSVTPTLSPREALDPTAIVSLLGLATENTLRPSSESITLQASFVASSGLSKALLADAQGSRLYRVGERLPGGSVLRRVEAHYVELWNKGREERLNLSPPVAGFMKRIEGSAEPAVQATSTRYLQPFSGYSE